MSTPRWMPESANHKLLDELHSKLQANGFYSTFGSGNNEGSITYRYVSHLTNSKLYLIATRDGNHRVETKCAATVTKELKRGNHDPSKLQWSPTVPR